MEQFVILALKVSPILAIGLFVWFLTKTKKILTWAFYIWVGVVILGRFAIKPIEMYQFGKKVVSSLLDPETAGHWVIFNENTPDPITISHNWVAILVLLLLSILFLWQVRK